MVCILSSALHRVHGIHVLKLKLYQRSSNLPVFVSRDAVFKCERTGHLNRIMSTVITSCCSASVLYCTCSCEVQHIVCGNNIIGLF